MVLAGFATRARASNARPTGALVGGGRRVCQHPSAALERTKRMSDIAPRQTPAPTGLQDLLRAREVISGQVVAAIRRLRLLGVSWSEIGRLLDMPKTTVLRQFGYVDRLDVAVVKIDGKAYLECLGTGVLWRDPQDLALEGDREVLGEFSRIRHQVEGVTL